MCFLEWRSNRRLHSVKTEAREKARTGYGLAADPFAMEVTVRCTRARLELRDSRESEVAPTGEMKGRDCSRPPGWYPLVWHATVVACSNGEDDTTRSLTGPRSRLVALACGSCPPPGEVGGDLGSTAGRRMSSIGDIRRCRRSGTFKVPSFGPGSLRQVERPVYRSRTLVSPHRSAGMATCDVRSDAGAPITQPFQRGHTHAAPWLCRPALSTVPTTSLQCEDRARVAPGDQARH